MSEGAAIRSRLRVALRHAWRLTGEILFFADTSTLRWRMAAASIAYAAGLLIDANAFSRPAFRLMRTMAEWVLSWVHLDGVVPPHIAWAVAFLVYAVGALWRIYEGKPRWLVALVVNSLGFGLWTGSTLLTTIALHHWFTPTMALGWVMSLMLLVVLWRTALNDEATSP